MILFQRHYGIVFIQVLILCANFPLLFGEHDHSKITAEEIIRRRKLVEPHLLQIAEEQKYWIETYHMNFGGHETIRRKIVESSNNDLMKDPIENKISSLESNEKILKQDTFLDYSDKSVVPETLSLDPEKVHRLKIVEDYVPKLKNLEMGIGLDHVDSTPMGSVASSSNSVEARFMDVSDELQRHSETYAFIKKFTDSPTQEPAEMNKYETKSGHSTSYHNNVDKDFVLRGNVKLTESEIENVDFNLKQNLKTFNLNTKHSMLPELHVNRNHCSVGSLKGNFLHVIKEITDLKVIKPNIYDFLPLNEISSTKNHEVNHPIFKTENTEPVKFKENDNLELTEKSNTVPKEVHIREKYVKSYISSLDKGKEYWRETYDFNFQKIDSEESFQYAPMENRYLSGNQNAVTKNIADGKPQERLYFHRWLKKFLNKLIGHPYSEHVNIVFSFSPDSLNRLQKLSTSEKYEISHVDEFISDLISNATISYDHNIYSFYASVSSIHFYIIISILLFVILFYMLIHFPYFKILPFFILCISILWHGCKMYAEKVAEKHAILSASSSEYCESILNKESGIFAHIKEFFRYSFYDDHCKKYFEALMVDPISELSIFIVVSDFVSSAFFQLFRPMARVLNSVVKDVFKDLSYFQVLCLFCILILVAIFLLFLVLIYNKYKLNFPLFMGSIEPTPLRGSRVEDIPLESKRKKSLPKENNELKNITNESPLKTFLTGNSYKSLTNPIENYNFSLKPLQNDPQTKICQSLKRRLSC